MSNVFPCPVGFYLDYTNGKMLGECKPCGIGNYCPEGSAAPTTCPAGQFNDFSNTAGACQTCPAGYYCPSGTTFANKCAPGFYSDSGAIACTLCEIGTYCPNEATTISEKLLNVCPAGVYCMRQLTNVNVVDASTGQTIAFTGKVGLHVYPDLVTYYCLQGYYCPAGT